MERRFFLKLLPAATVAILETVQGRGVVAQTASPTPPTGPDNNLGMNFGHQADHYDLFSNGEISKDLEILAKAGIDSIRTSDMGWNNPESEALAVFAKSKGFKVIIGGDWDKLSADQLDNYSSQVLQEAAWAETNGIDQLSLGNEQEYRLIGMTNADLIAFYKSLATKVKQVYSGKVSYETSSDFLNDWVASGELRDIDELGFNSYCGYDCNASNLQAAIDAFGVEHVYVSEINADMGTGKYNYDATHAAEIKGDLMQLMQQFPDTDFYYFTFAACKNADGVPDKWGLLQCGKSAQPKTAGVLGIK